MSVKKLTIKAFTKPGGSKVSGDDFSVLINPEKLKMDYRIEYTRTQAMGTTGPTLKFKHIPSTKVNFTLIFDGTGLIRNAQGNQQNTQSVYEQITAFKAKTIRYDGDTHCPNFLQLVWGNYFFEGYLTDLSITYKLFKPDGTPIRAEADVTFNTSVDGQNAKKAKRKKSPDLTHVRTISSNDRLPAMCNDFYDGTNYFVQVAKHNQLNTLRSLKVGSEIVFPPLMD